MRRIATVLLTVLCVASSWAADGFTDDQLKQISDAAAKLGDGAGGSITLTVNGASIAVGLYKSANGSVIVAGDGVPAASRGTYTFTTGAGSLGVAFRPAGGGAQQTRTFAVGANPTPNQANPVANTQPLNVPQLLGYEDVDLNSVQQRNFIQIGTFGAIPDPLPWYGLTVVWQNDADLQLRIGPYGTIVGN